jgi:ribosomal protein S18 acetylase RimI-like enzyme
MSSTQIVTLTAERAETELEALSEVLVDCVAGGASVNFMQPFGLDDARAFWRKIIADVAAGNRALFGALHEGVLLGTVQLILAVPPNQTHRAEIAKLLVHRKARRRGLARALMLAAEGEARLRDRTLLTMDTASGAAERLYSDLGYVRVGVIPGYARLPDGPFCDTVVFYKKLA